MTPTSYYLRQSLPQRANSASRKLREEKVEGRIGSYNSRQGLSVNCILHVSHILSRENDKKSLFFIVSVRNQNPFSSDCEIITCF